MLFSHSEFDGSGSDSGVYDPETWNLDLGPIGEPDYNMNFLADIDSMVSSSQEPFQNDATLSETPVKPTTVNPSSLESSESKDTTPSTELGLDDDRVTPTMNAPILHSSVNMSTSSSSRTAYQVAKRERNSKSMNRVNASFRFELIPNRSERVEINMLTSERTERIRELASRKGKPFSKFALEEGLKTFTSPQVCLNYKLLVIYEALKEFLPEPSQRKFIQAPAMMPASDNGKFCLRVKTSSGYDEDAVEINDELQADSFKRVYDIGHWKAFESFRLKTKDEQKQMLQKVLEKDGKPKRPLNSWFLYKECMVDTFKYFRLVNHFFDTDDYKEINQISKNLKITPEDIEKINSNSAMPNSNDQVPFISLLWQTEDESVTQFFQEFSKIEKLHHQEAFPGYKFDPVSPKKKEEEEEGNWVIIPGYFSLSMGSSISQTSFYIFLYSSRTQDNKLEIK